MKGLGTAHCDGNLLTFEARTRQRAPKWCKTSPNCMIHHKWAPIPSLWSRLKRPGVLIRTMFLATNPGCTDCILSSSKIYSKHVERPWNILELHICIICDGNLATFEAWKRHDNVPQNCVRRAAATFSGGANT